MQNSTQHPISDALKARISAQVAPAIADKIFANLQHLGANPETNEQMKISVNRPDYEDRGMWGPLGGKGGTLSQPWLAEQASIANGGASEFGLMTVVPPPSGAREDGQEQ